MKQTLFAAIRVTFFWGLVLLGALPIVIRPAHAQPRTAPASAGAERDPAPLATPTDPGHETSHTMPGETGGSRTAAPAQAAPFPPVYVFVNQRTATRHLLPALRYHRARLASRGAHMLGRGARPYHVSYERQRVAIDVSPAILHYAHTFRLDPYLVKAVMFVESRFENSATSGCGAAGLMQLMPGTGYAMGARNLYDPEQNIAAGTRYLRYLMDMYEGKLELAVAAYNAGPGNVRHCVPNISETRQYVRKVMSAYKEFKRQGKGELHPPQ